MNASVPEGKLLVQFDGICILCSRTVRFILKADRKKKFLFQPLQNLSGTRSFDTVIVVGQHETYQYFDAILKIGFELGGIYRSVAVLKLIPRRWRHSLYLCIARNRYRWFGQRKTCYIPSEEERERFI